MSTSLLRLYHGLDVINSEAKGEQLQPLWLTWQPQLEIFRSCNV